MPDPKNDDQETLKVNILKVDGKRVRFVNSLKALLILNESEEAPMMRVLAKQVGVSAAALTKIVDGLQDQGFLKRQRIGDRRKIQLVITPKGRKFAKSIT